ncbi:elongation factor Ts, mitochondrial [Cryptococcus amylolentus CBS 6039]|uniref:Elongation factor Ts, mitochondrial n=1 Tax=Cryptococcus amylolentus CBS 6039 TaxID=1295533 RepID=A0A1E3I7D1_9TREE|nr:elongation factor Ts, mitochondrial [Cryptococcus amylolentus CBS 6039]ODN84482.1 elongation factor Ts, mitochondrial [Cryptococcus amylolentus CBS 6039]
MLGLLPKSSLRTAISRSLHTSPARLAEGKTKVPVSLIAALRKSHPVPLAAAREALERCNLDLEAALDYLRTTTSASAEKKAAKVSGRDTNEGVITISLLGGKRVGMVHLGCETDFVARNDVFLKTARGVAETTAFLDVPGEHEKPKLLSNSASIPDPILEFPTESLLSAPVISLPSDTSSDNITPIPTSEPTTIKQSLLSSLSQTGENLRLLRAVSFAAPFPSTPTVRFVPGGYAHGGSSDKEGKVGGVVVLAVTGAEADKPIASIIHGPGGDELEKSLESLARTVARQVVGFPTKAIERGDRAVEDEEVLMEQAFMMFQGDSRSVKEVLAEWGKERGVVVKVVGMRRWSVGDELETIEA